MTTGLFEPIQLISTHCWLLVSLLQIASRYHLSIRRIRLCELNARSMISVQASAVALLNAQHPCWFASWPVLDARQRWIVSNNFQGHEAVYRHEINDRNVRGRSPFSRLRCAAKLTIPARYNFRQFGVTMAASRTYPDPLWLPLHNHGQLQQYNDSAHSAMATCACTHGPGWGVRWGVPGAKAPSTALSNIHWSYNLHLQTVIL